MNKEIKVLDNNLINKIAAGEVIERPASIVKELVENSIDAKATNITIEIKNGGIDFIKIMDNGSGIKRDQVKTAFLRHSTSKLSKIEDLDSIFTLGFRGEALATVASISQLELITKTIDDPIGKKICISGGNIISEEDVPCLDGSLFTIKNVFYNVPARRKFLKKDSVESSYISDVITRLALGNPNIAFKYINNGATVFQTFGKDLKTTVLNIYGKEFFNKTIPLEKEKDGFKITGLIGLPELSRANRNYYNFFINNRYIKSSLVNSAVEDAFLGKIMVHKFPVFIINLTVPKNFVDVNVHPTKLEVRFENEDFIYDFIKESIENLLKSQVLIPEVKADNDFKNLISKNDEEKNILNKIDENIIKNLILEKNDEKLIVEDTKENPLENNEEKNFYYTAPPTISNKLFVKEDVSLKEDVFKVNTISEKTIANENEFKNTIFNEIQLDTNTKNNSFFNNYKIIGQILNTYWIVEQNNEIYMIDQHSAHEKIIYEEFYNKFKNDTINSQILLQPLIINVSEKEKVTIEENIELLNKFGFKIEEFGPRCYSIVAVPFIFTNSISPSFFIEIIDTLDIKNLKNIYDFKIEKIISMSCKKAVKANDKLNYIEAKSLIDNLLKLENPFNCPHGRPTIIKMTKYEIEKLFKRIQN